MFFLCSVIVTAQEKLYAFSWQETVRSNYGLIFSPTGDNPIQTGLNSIKGQVQIRWKDDRTAEVILKTDTALSDFYADVPQQVLIPFTLLMDEQENIYRINVSAGQLSILQMHLSWLSEWMSARKQQPGTVEVSGVEGKYSATQKRIIGEDGRLILKRSQPVLVINEDQRSYLSFDQYDWTSTRQKSGQLHSLNYQSSFRQFLGRNQLSCVNRKFSLKETDGANSLFDFVAAGDPIDFYPLQKMSPADRQQKINSQVLGRLSKADLLKELSQAGQLSDEADFRLGSKWRAYASLTGDSSVFDSLLRVLPARSPAGLVIERALIASSIPYATSYILRQLNLYRDDYPSLKSLLLLISGQHLSPVRILDAVMSLRFSDNENIRNLSMLTAAGLTYALKKKDRAVYQSNSDLILQQYIDKNKILKDTLQYLYVAGNLGAEQVFPELRNLYAQVPEFREEVLLAVQRMQSPCVDSLLVEYFKSTGYSTELLLEIFSGHKIPAGLREYFIDQVKEADGRGDESRISLMKLLLNKRWSDGIEMNSLVEYPFRTTAYVSEMKDYLAGQFDCFPKKM